MSVIYGQVSAGLTSSWINGHPLRTFWLCHPKRHPSGVAFLVSSLKTITAINNILVQEKCWKTIVYLSLLAACVVRRRAPLSKPSTEDREHLLPCCEQPTQQFVVAPCRAVKTLQGETRADGCLRHRIELLFFLPELFLILTFVARVASWMERTLRSGCFSARPSRAAIELAKTPIACVSSTHFTSKPWDLKKITRYTIKIVLKINM